MSVKCNDGGGFSLTEDGRLGWCSVLGGVDSVHEVSRMEWTDVGLCFRASLCSWLIYVVRKWGGRMVGGEVSDVVKKRAGVAIDSCHLPFLPT